ncbi:PadR family transcriptional regulator [Nocardia goodfellowii]|uniref:DNA-binding PadR family transcriptional regulator n=1 Tax=Nocardia goodfellowii TaxID=882446 RepID=A0ABS4QQI5_9NOCA|nr:PadR family transcriptional regulator [Nocardia goodfellowii]MBP2193977.1 DNA-binding PadR family transcriptional regulator [Nocardia goodfellowii]
MSLRYAVLGMLAAEGPASGYDLLQIFKDSLANIWPATQSQIYTELTKLAESGLIAVSEAGARGRKEYTIAPEGLTELRRWLTETKPKQAPRNDLLLRVFFLGVLEHDQARDYLSAIETRMTKAGAALSELEASIEWEDDAFSVYGHIALEWGKRFYAMNEEWARWALTQMPPPER